MSENPEASDPANYLRTAAELASYLRGAMKERDVRHLMEARRHAARAMGRWQIEPTPELKALLGLPESSWEP